MLSKLRVRIVKKIIIDEKLHWTAKLCRHSEIVVAESIAGDKFATR